jgi:hypothetical protein
MVPHFLRACMLTSLWFLFPISGLSYSQHAFLKSSMTGGRHHPTYLLAYLTFSDTFFIICEVR